MKVLVVTYNCIHGKREDFLQAVAGAGIDKASRAESGNIRYDYFRSTDDDDKLLLLETWKDEAAFNSHCASAHFKELGSLKEKYVSETILEKYEKQ